MSEQYRGIEDVLREMVLAPKGYSELYERALARARKISFSAPRLEDVKRRELARIDAASSYLSSFLRRLALSSPFLRDMHPFHRELAELAVNADEYRRCLALIYGAARIVEKIARDQRRRVIAATRGREAVRARRQFFARVRSLLEELDECFGRLRAYQLELLKLPNVDPALPTVIIAGPPNVGKSSLLRAVSRARPEVREYPFTTKRIVIGHVELADGSKVQVLDTPGLLDRPMSDRNPIELQAVLAMKHLRGVVLFLFDPSETCGFPLEYQLSVYRDVRSSFPETPCIPVANKVDVTPRERALALVRMLGGDAKDLFFVSALRGTNVGLLVRAALDALSLIHI